MADDSDFQLDEETLRKIEEEALREVEAEFELDEKTLLEIEEAAKREAGLEGVDLGDDFLEELRTEAQKISDDDLDLDNLDLDLDLGDLDFDKDMFNVDNVPSPKPEKEPILDLGPEPDLSVEAASPTPKVATAEPSQQQAILDRDAKAFPNFDGKASAPKIAMPTPAASSVIAPPPPPPKASPQLNIQAPKPPPKPAPQMGVVVQDEGLGSPKEEILEEARTQALKRAHGKVKRKAVAKAAKVAKEQVSTRSQSVSPNAINIHELEMNANEKSNTVMIAAVLAGVIILGGLCAMIGIVLYHKAEAEKNANAKAEPIHVLTDRQGNPIKASDVEAVKLYNKIMRISRKNKDEKGQIATVETIDLGLELIKKLRSKYPDFAAKKERPLEQKETKLKEWRKIMADFGSGD